MMVGDEAPVSELWSELRDGMPIPLDDRPGQPVYTLHDAPEPAGSALRLATLQDLDLLVVACAHAYEEEVGIDAYARDPEMFRWRTRSQIEAGRSWIWREGERILFKAEASAWTPSAVQLQQVWVDPSLRGRGFGRAGFADLCRELLAVRACRLSFRASGQCRRARVVRGGADEPCWDVSVAHLSVTNGAASCLEH